MSICIRVLTPLSMSLVNLSFRFEVRTDVLMSTWLHSALISAFSPAILLQDNWKCTYLRWLTQIGCSILSNGPVGAWGPCLAGPEPDRWINTAKNPVASSTVEPAKLVSYLCLPLITSYKILCLSFKHVGLRRNRLSAIWVFAVFSTQALLHYVRLLSPVKHVSLRELGKGK